MTKRLEAIRKSREEAMPLVKALVKRFGRTSVQACLNALRDYEKKLKRLAEAKREVAALERDVK